MAEQEQETTETTTETAAETATKKVITKESYAIIAFDEQWNGHRISRVMSIDEWNKFEISVPSAKTIEELVSLCEILNLKPEQIMDLGFKQHSYNSDTNVRNLINEKVKDGEIPDSYIDDVQATLEEDLIWTEPTTKVSVAKVNKEKAKKVDEAEKRTGLDIDTQARIFEYASDNNVTIAEARTALDL